MNLESFFNNYMDDYSNPHSGMMFVDFCDFLRAKKILKGNAKKIIPSDIIIKKCFMKKDTDVVIEENVNDFQKYILGMLKSKENPLWTWNGAINKVELKETVFCEMLENLGYYDSENDEYTQKGKNNGILYNLLTNKVLDTIVKNVGVFDDINDVFFIQWVGPFSSVEECNEWENEHSISNKEFNFYFGCGKQANKHKQSFYIGKSERNFITSRISQETDPITRDFRENADKEIWIGRFSDKELRSDKSEEVRKRNHKAVENAEWALIYGFKKKNPNLFNALLNDKKTKNPPKTYITIINQWYKKNSFEFWQRKNKNICSGLLPDIILYNGEDYTKFAEILKFN